MNIEEKIDLLSAKFDKLLKELESIAEEDDFIDE